MTIRGTVLRLAKSNCPYCDHKIDAVGTADGSPATPQPGDATTCMFCARIIIFVDGLGLRKPRDGELETMFLLHPERVPMFAKLQSIIRTIPPEPRR